MTDQPDTRTEPEEVHLFLGGPHHGHYRTVPAAAPTWLDIVTATTYRRGQINQAVAHPLTGQPHTAWQRDVMVHETVPDEQMVTALVDVLVASFVRAGRQMPVTVIAGPPTSAIADNGTPPGR